MQKKETHKVVPISTTIYCSEITDSEKLSRCIQAGRANWDYIIDVIRALDNVAVKQQYLTTTQQISYCKAYLFALTKEYCSEPEDREILRMTFGLLENYQTIKNLTDRRKEYMSHMKHTLAKDSIDTTVAREENRIIEQLAIEVVESLNAKQGLLGIANALELNFELPKADYPKTSPLWGKKGKKPSQENDTTEEYQEDISPKELGTENDCSPDEKENTALPEKEENSPLKAELTALQSQSKNDETEEDFPLKVELTVSQSPSENDVTEEDFPLKVELTASQSPSENDQTEVTFFEKHKKHFFIISVVCFLGIALAIVYTVINPRYITFPVEQSYSPSVDTSKFVTRINSDPAFSYMISLGIIQAIEENELSEVWANEYEYLKIKEFVSLTDEASIGQDGLDFSIWYSEDDGTGNTFTLEYSNISSALNNLLFLPHTEKEMQDGISKRNWTIKNSDNIKNVRIEESPIQINSSWTTITLYPGSVGKKLVFGFSQYDMRFGYLDPSTLLPFNPEADWHVTDEDDIYR